MFSVEPILSIGDMKPFQDGQDWFGITVRMLLMSVMSDITSTESYVLCGKRIAFIALECGMSR